MRDFQYSDVDCYGPVETMKTTRRLLETSMKTRETAGTTGNLKYSEIDCQRQGSLQETEGMTFDFK